MRIGIVTFHCAYNFGSALQAVALKLRLERMGHDVRVIDYRGRDFRQYKNLRICRHPKDFFVDLGCLNASIRRRDSFESFMDAHMNLTRRFTCRDEGALESLQDNFDCFVCGSDQIWNLDCTHGPVGPYFLSFAGDRRRIAYAPSLAHTSFLPECFGPAERGRIAEWLSRFDAISVREASTASTFQSLVEKKIETCLDPTLLLDVPDYAPLMAPKGSCGDCSGEIFAYMLEENPVLVSYVSALARKLGLGVSHVSKRRLGFGVPARNLYGMGPDGFLRVVSDSHCVVTNSFHATVFSLMFGKPFQTFCVSKASSRMEEILDGLGFASHLIDGSAVVEPVAESIEDFETASALARLRSEAFLTRALGE